MELILRLNNPHDEETRRFNFQRGKSTKMKKLRYAQKDWQYY